MSRLISTGFLLATLAIATANDGQAFPAIKGLGSAVEQDGTLLRAGYYGWRGYYGYRGGYYGYRRYGFGYGGYGYRYGYGYAPYASYYYSRPYYYYAAAPAYAYPYSSSYQNCPPGYGYGAYYGY